MTTKTAIALELLDQLLSNDRNARAAGMAQPLNFSTVVFKKGARKLMIRYAGYRPHYLQKPALLKSRALR
jgi:hypothetical protein